MTVKKAAPEASKATLAPASDMEDYDDENVEALLREVFSEEEPARGKPGEGAKKNKRSRTDKYLTQPKVIPGGGVVCISRLPHGFYEAELRSYLSQFGGISRLRVSRNSRTGASRHYAFVEFRHAEVAKIVVETMNNYLLAGHLLQCSLVAEEKIHPELWKGANRRFVKVDWRKREAQKHNQTMEERGEELAALDRERLKKQQTRFQELGIDYDVSGVLGGELVL